MLYVLIILYFVSSVVWFFYNIGNKRKEDTIVDYFLCIPIIVIGGIFSIIGIVFCVIEELVYFLKYRNK
jgi:hypothetical protein